MFCRLSNAALYAGAWLYLFLRWCRTLCLALCPPHYYLVEFPSKDDPNLIWREIYCTDQAFLRPLRCWCEIRLVNLQKSQLFLRSLRN